MCSRCGTYGCAECAFSSVAGREICRACAATGLTEPVPWEQRKELGWWTAFFRTTKLVMLEPSATFRTPATDGGVVGPLAYAALAYTIGQLVLMLFVLAMMVTMGIGMAALTEEPAIGAIFAGYGLCLVPLTLVQAPVYALLGTLISGASSHGILKLSGAASVPFDRSLRAVAYANAAHIFDVVSCITPFWVIALETIALREVHRCSTGAALFATIAWRLLVVLSIVGFYAAFVAIVVLTADGTRPVP